MVTIKWAYTDRRGIRRCKHKAYKCPLWKGTKRMDLSDELSHVS